MKKAAVAFIVLISINVLCMAQTFKTSLQKPDDKVKTDLSKTTPALITTTTIVAERSKIEFEPVTETQIKGNGTDSSIVTKSDATGKAQNDKRKNSTQKDEIRDLRIHRINMAILNLAQIFNYL
ncbi:MAG: hypothetical protein IPP81_09045 [Chitinophagaceae bacterium]|nr:hypothetical protein [Chitinophagaceae bacterium]